NQETVNGLSFSSIGSLTGGSGADTFVFANGAAVTGTIDGGTGTDVLKYSLYSSAITVDLTANTATGTGGIANLEGVIGSSSSNTSDTLIGPNLVNPVQGNIWTITGSNAGTVNSFTFSGIENLTGGPQVDSFVIPNGQKFNGKIDGGDTTEFNTLDFSAYTTAVNVDLTAGTATNISGGISNITDVLGGSGNDTLKGGQNPKGSFLSGNGGDDTITGTGGGDILVGGSGNDTITGGDGRDLIMGGDGQDTLSGGGGEDIIINGTTSFDTDSDTQNAILDFWKSTSLDFAFRVSQLRAGGAMSDNITLPALDSTNIFDDGFSDTLTGGTTVTPTDDNLDWFFAKLSSPAVDTITDLSSGEAIN
ncbi:MAG TPA: calcium-binding protein, partial [Pirellulales bacterium]|nr:calcium-binding protein [Pirellulales bacterium]